MNRLQGKVAIVTGAASGQGAEEVRRFVEEGARVIVADVNPAGDVLARQLGEAAQFQRLDVRDEGRWTEVVALAEGSFGPVDILVNNAGIVAGGGLQQMDPTIFRDLFEVNTVGAFLGMRAVVASMRRAGAGSIINISSIAGMNGSTRSIGYTASKFALRGITKAAALELAPFKIRVNSVHPGYIDTPMSRSFEEESQVAGKVIADLPPLGIVGLPEHVAHLVVYLASDESAFTTGTEHVIDGGLLAGYPTKDQV